MKMSDNIKVKSKDRVVNEAYIDSLEESEVKELARRSIGAREIIAVLSIYLVIAICVIGGMGYALNKSNDKSSDADALNQMGERICELKGETFITTYTSNSRLTVIIDCSETSERLNVKYGVK